MVNLSAPVFYTYSDSRLPEIHWHACFGTGASCDPMHRVRMGLLCCESFTCCASEARKKHARRFKEGSEVSLFALLYVKLVLG